MAKEKRIRPLKVKGLRLKRNNDGTYTDQYGRILRYFLNREEDNDLRPIGLDPRGARH